MRFAGSAVEGQVRDDIRAFVVEQLHDDAAVLVVDETGRLKKPSSTGKPVAGACQLQVMRPGFRAASELPAAAAAAI
ncbi:hypothetical protein [Streptomyces sp. NPDC058694]|uniref:hypothetical protein n=1 Tax=Streptomyces sp. NPDC058694 TaxID=3346603 RepID=UPI00365FCE38